jgi:type IV pilus assembly protein PilC
LRQALVYPSFVCTIAFGVCLGLMVWAVPTFQQLFDGFGAPLPALTRAVLGLSALLAAYGPVWLLALAMSGAALWTAAKYRPTLRDALQARLLRVPLIGPLRAKIALAHWANGLSTLLIAGIPLVDALATLERVTGNPVFDRASARLASRLRRGERLAVAMRTVGCFPPAVVQIVEIAEHAGALDRMVADIGRRSAAEAQARISGYMRCIEPLVISLCGGFVAILVIALYLPIIELGNVV